MLTYSPTAEPQLAQCGEASGWARHETGRRKKETAPRSGGALVGWGSIVIIILFIFMDCFARSVHPEGGR